MGRFFRTIIALFLLCFLSGCIVPEDFDLRLTARDEGLSVAYDGKIVALQVLADGKDMSRSDKARHLQGIDDSMRKEIGKYGGKYESDYDVDGVIDVKTSFTYPYENVSRKQFGNIFVVLNDGEGVFTVQTKEIDPSERNYLKSLGIDLDDVSGDISFEPTEGIKVLRHNADSEPGLFSNAYKWDLAMGNGKVMRIVFEVESVKKAIAAERERKARKKAEAERQYIEAIAAYQRQVVAARAKAQRVFDNIKPVGLECSYSTKEGGMSWEPVRYTMHAVFDIQNANDEAVRVRGYVVALRDRDGKELTRGTFKPRKNDLEGHGTQHFDLDLHLSDVGRKEKVRARFLKGGVSVAVYPDPEWLQAGGSYLKPNGSPFLPEEPEPDPSLSEGEVWRGWDNPGKTPYQKLLEAGKIKPLPAAPEAFALHASWAELRKRELASKPTPEPAPKRTSAKANVKKDDKPAQAPEPRKITVTPVAVSDGAEPKSEKLSGGLPEELAEKQSEERESAPAPAKTEKKAKIGIKDIEEGIRGISGILNTLKF